MVARRCAHSSSDVRRGSPAHERELAPSRFQMTTRQRKADGLMIRYADSEGGGDETVLLLNPWPESLFAWETIWSPLAQTARLIAIDLPGFGHSEGRADLLSP